MTTGEHYLQGGLDYDFVDGLDPRLECSICLLCLRNPHQTSCGHLFCFSCILTWLQEGKSCPHDNCSLGEGDLFPDKKTAEDIDQLLIRCPKGCTKIISVREIQSHHCNPVCPQCGDLLPPDQGHREGTKGHALVCPNASVACTYSGMGCSVKPRRKELNRHLQEEMPHHLKLLHEKMNKLQQMQALPPLCQSDKTMQDLFDRVVSLEQSICHQAIRQEEALRRLHQLSLPTNTGCCFHQGVLLWRIKRFTSIVEQDSNHVLYSPAFFTQNPLGYKVCLRASFQNGHLGVYVHFMSNVDDDLISWPFKGQIVLRLRNRQKIGDGDLVETMTSVSHMSAFQRPPSTGLRNPVGFGLQELISVSSLKEDGFWDSSSDDIVIIGRVMPSSSFVCQDH